MPSQGRADHSDTGSRRADIVPGDIEGKSCDEQVTWTIEEHFRDNDYTVKPNTPYKGGWITRYYGQPEDDIHAIQIEVNRDLYMNEKTFERNDSSMQQLAQSCAQLIPKLSTIELG
jgi:N-formylglutamate amidohydrolase